MAQLTREQTQKLETVRTNIARAVKYMRDPRVIGIATQTQNPNGADYTIRNPAALEHCHGTVEHVAVMNKEIGSDIAGLYTALTLLDEFLDNPTGQIKLFEL